MRKEVLIVEADRRSADTLVLRLTSRGYGVASAASLAEAEQALAARRPDLVVLGLGLTGGDRLIRRVRAAGGATLPVLLLGTGAESIASTADAVAAGADDFFRKPAELDLVVEKVAVLLGAGRAEADGQPTRVGPLPRDTSEGPAPMDSVVDWDDSLDLAGEFVSPRPASQPRGPLQLTEQPAEARQRHEIPAIEDPPLAAGAREVSAGPAPVRPSAAPRPASLPPLPAGLRALPRVSRPPTAAPAEAPRPSAPPDHQPVSKPIESIEVSGGTRPADLPLGDRPGRGFQAPQAPVSEAEAEHQAHLQPGRSLPLAERPLPVALAAAARQGLSGRIEVAAGGALRRIFLDAGRTVFFDSSDAEEDLAATLVAEGLVTRSAVARARTRARAVGATADEVLIEQGFVTAEAAYRALRVHVIEHVVALFALESGDALVVSGGPRPPDPVDLGLPPGRLVMDGIRRRYGRLRLYQAYGTPVTVPRVRRPTGDLSLRADEESVLRACDGRRTAAEIARGLRLGEVDVLAILYGLAVLGCLESPIGVGPGALPPLPAGLLARAAAPRTPDELPGYADLVARKLADVQTADYFTLLEVPRGATGAEVEAAWETLRRRFDPQRMRPEAPLASAVTEIAAVLDDARSMLTDGRLRARYEAALGD